MPQAGSTRDKQRTAKQIDSAATADILLGQATPFCLPCKLDTLCAHRRSHMDWVRSGLTIKATRCVNTQRDKGNRQIENIGQCIDFTGPPYTIRTCDLRLRRPLLYPTELRAVGEKRHGLSRTVFGIGLSSNARQRPHRQTQTPETKRARHEAEPEIIPDHRTRSRETGPPRHQTGCGCSMNQPRQNTPAITQYTPNDASRPRPSK